MGHRHRKDLAASRRRVEDEGDEEGVLDVGSDNDDSLSEGSIISEGGELPEGDEVVNIDIPSTDHREVVQRPNGSRARNTDAELASSSNGVSTGSKNPRTNGTSDMDMMLNGLRISDSTGVAAEAEYEDLTVDTDIRDEVPSPAVVNSTAQMDQAPELPYERRRREHEEYKKKRDADPAFVPNRGAFFMHDHRHSGPAANGFRPFGRGRGRGGRPGVGPYPHPRYLLAPYLSVISIY